MSYYPQGGYQNSAPAGYQSQQYYGYSQQQGQYGGGAAPVRYPVGAGYQHQHQAYTPNQQMNKTMHSNAPNPFMNPRQPGSTAEYQQYPNTAGYGQETSGYYLPHTPTQKNYQTRPHQSNPAPSYPYNYYATSAPTPPHTGYMYGYTGNQSGHQQSTSTDNTPTESNITPQQQQAIQNWIVEKQNPASNRGAVRGVFNRGGGKSRFGPAVGIPINKRFQRGFPKDTPRVANYFCEACKVSCGTSDAYNTHLNGKSHKKKLNNPIPTVPSSGKLFKCDICDVLCTGKDAFKAHIVGIKHKKVVKLYEVMGKPLPEIKDAPVGVGDIAAMGAHIQKTGRPLINFVKSSKELRMRGEENDEETSMSVDTEENSDHVLSSGGKKKTKSKRKNIKSDKPFARPLRTGLEGFTDSFGVPLHVINTRDVFVPPPRPDQWGWNGEQMERYYVDTALRRNKYDDFSILDVHRKIYPSQKELESLYGTLEDVEKSLNSISLKLHSEQIEKLRESLPSTETEEQSMQMEEAKPEVTTETIKLESTDEGENVVDANSDSFVVQEKGDETITKTGLLTQEQEDSLRVIQGFQRVGDASKGINLSGNLQAELVVICTVKPTKDLLQTIVDMLPTAISDVTKYTYQVTPQSGLAGFQVVYCEEEISVCVTVTLTSLDMREQPPEEEAKADENKGVLDRSCCQLALCQMRRTKWFQGQAICLPSYILIIRVLRDISRRVPAWTCLDSWILELLLQKVISNCPREYTRPGDIIRSFVACIASGFFLPGAPGLMDPCEKDKVDASHLLSPQQREDLTFSAQHALRLISFKQLHKVLGLDNAPRMQDIRESTTPPRMHMRRYVSNRNTYRPRKKIPSVSESSEKKSIAEETTNET